MPLTDRSECPDRTDAVLAWLCRNHEGNRFLTSVHEWAHRPGGMTAAQRVAVERDWRRAGAPGLEVVLGDAPIESRTLNHVHDAWEVNRRRNEYFDGEVGIERAARDRFYRERGWVYDYAEERWLVLVDEPPVISFGDEPVGERIEFNLFDEQAARVHAAASNPHTPVAPRTYVGTPATSSDSAAGVLNGYYDVGRVVEDDEDDDDHRIRIHTITHSRRTPDLVGKRVVGYMNESGLWVNFGYLTTSGHLRLWRRFESDSTAPHVVAARMMLEGYTTPNLGREVIHVDALGVEWSWQLTRGACRYCNESLDTPRQREVGHDSCAGSPTPYVAPEVRPRRRDIYTPRPAPQRPTLETVEVRSTPSQLGTVFDGQTWEQ